MKTNKKGLNLGSGGAIAMAILVIIVLAVVGGKIVGTVSDIPDYVADTDLKTTQKNATGNQTVAGFTGTAFTMHTDCVPIYGNVSVVNTQHTGWHANASVTDAVNGHVYITAYNWNTTDATLQGANLTIIYNCGGIGQIEYNSETSLQNFGDLLPIVGTVAVAAIMIGLITALMMRRR